MRILEFWILNYGQQPQIAPSLNLYSSPFPGEFSFLSVLLKYLLPLSFEITWTLQKKNFKARWKILCLFRHQSVFRQNWKIFFFVSTPVCLLYQPYFYYNWDYHRGECNARMATCGLTGPPTPFLATCPRPLPSTSNPVALTSSPTLLLPHINVPSNLKTTTLLSYAMQQILLLRCVPPSPTQNSLTNHLFVSSAINFRRCRNRWTKHDWHITIKTHVPPWKIVGFKKWSFNTINGTNVKRYWLRTKWHCCGES